MFTLMLVLDIYGGFLLYWMSGHLLAHLIRKYVYSQPVTKFEYFLGTAKAYAAAIGFIAFTNLLGI